MENTVIKATPGRAASVSKPRITHKKIHEQDIRNRAYEIYLANMNSTSDEMDDWLYAEKELKAKIK